MPLDATTVEVAVALMGGPTGNVAKQLVNKDTMPIYSGLAQHIIKQSIKEDEHDAMKLILATLLTGLSLGLALAQLGFNVEFPVRKDKAA